MGILTIYMISTILFISLLSFICLSREIEYFQYKKLLNDRKKIKKEFEKLIKIRRKYEEYYDILLEDKNYIKRKID